MYIHTYIPPGVNATLDCQDMVAFPWTGFLRSQLASSLPKSNVNDTGSDLYIQITLRRIHPPSILLNNMRKYTQTE